MPVYTFLALFLRTLHPSLIILSPLSLNFNLLYHLRWFLVDRWGRRAILMSGASVVCAIYWFISPLSMSLICCITLDGFGFDRNRMVDVRRGAADASSCRDMRDSIQCLLRLQVPPFFSFFSVLSY